MRKLKGVGLLSGLILGVAVALVSNTRLIHAGYDISCWRRSDANSYVYTLLYEGYNWGGGWWNDNNSVDSGEGPDCSGSVFKTWAMEDEEGNSGKYYWNIGDNIHGPYSSGEFRDGCSGACYDVCGSGTSSSCGLSSYGSTEYMDAFARSGHVAIIYYEASNGYDYVIEAPGSYYIANLVNYRLQNAYDGVRRSGWDIQCPQ